MASEHNRIRGKWQDYSGNNASIAEGNFFDAFNKFFGGTNYRIRSKPRDFQKLYVDVQLDPHLHKEVYVPKDPVTRHGVSPDYAIDNLTTGKTIYVEVKRQDGWVEGKDRKAGRGNAHERSCKFFTPGLMHILREKGGIAEPALPFWTVFLGDITRDPCRVREIVFWYDRFISHVFFWRDAKDPKLLLKHFDDHIASVLD